MAFPGTYKVTDSVLHLAKILQTTKSNQLDWNRVPCVIVIDSTCRWLCFPPTGTLTLIENGRLYCFPSTLAQLLGGEERIYESSRTPRLWDSPHHHSAGANALKPTGHQPR